jgi:hypothetical protein
MKTLAMVLLVLVCPAAFAGPAGKPGSDVESRIRELSGLTDFMTDKDLEGYNQMRSESASIFPELMRLLHQSEDDDVLGVTFAIAETGANTHRKEIVDASVFVLKNRDSAVFRRGAQCALESLAKYGTNDQLELIAQFQSNGDHIIRTNAAKALSAIQHRTDGTPTQRVEPNGEPSKQHAVKGRPANGTTEDTGGLWWWIGGGIVLALAALAILKFRMSRL